jgi:hypothetical protein
MEPNPDPTGNLQPVATLEDALRAVVRDELTRAGLAPSRSEPPNDHTAPTTVDLIILAVVAADCALALVVYSAADNSAVQSFVKVMQWTGGTVFVAAVTWFQKRFLLLTRGMAFRAIACAAFLLMLPQQVPFAPILVPRAAEIVSELKFDNTDRISQSSGRRFVTVASHTLTTTPADQKCAMATQPQLVVNATDLWSDIWQQRVVPVYYEGWATFPADDGVKLLSIARRDRPFTSDEIDIVRKSLAVKKSGRLRDGAPPHQKIQIDVDGKIAASQLRLANGRYQLELRDKNDRCLGRVCGLLDNSFNDDCMLMFEPDQCSRPCPP